MHTLPQTAEAPVLDTEVEMKDAKAALQEEAAALKAALGVPETQPGEEEEQVEPEVDEKLLEELMSMGFSRARSRCHVGVLVSTNA